MRKIYVFFSLLLVLLIGCEKDEIQELLAEEGVQQKTNTKRLKEISFSNLPEELEAVFNNKNFIKTKKGKPSNYFGSVKLDEPIKVIIDENGNSSFTLLLNKNKNTSNRSLYFDNLVILDKGQKGKTSYVIRYEPTLAWYKNSRDFTVFTGSIIFYSLEGQAFKKLSLEEGVPLDPNQKSVCTVKLKSVVTICTDGGSINAEGSYIDETCVTTYNYKVNCMTGGGSGNNGGSSGNGGGGPNGPGGHSGSGGGSQSGTGGDGGLTDFEPVDGWTPPTIPDEDFDVKIDSSIKDHPCLSLVINKVLNSNNSLFTETIGNFIDNPKYDLIFKIGSCSVTDIACTDDSNLESKGEISIIIEDTNMNPIDVAATIFHEGIHAEIFRYVKEHHDGYIDPNDKPQLFDYYRHYKLAIDQEDIDHPYMTQYYITPIAEALRELDNNQYPLDYYKIFAWDGLRNFDPNNSLGTIDDDYNQYRNEMTENFNIVCND